MNTVITSDLRIIGDLVGSGSIRIDGLVEGIVRGRNLTIGEGGHVEGRIYAETVLINGSMRGRVVAVNVTLGSCARVIGKVFHHVLKIEPGAVHDGLKPWRPINFFKSGSVETDEE